MFDTRGHACLSCIHSSAVHNTDGKCTIEECTCKGLSIDHRSDPIEHPFKKGGPPPHPYKKY